MRKITLLLAFIVPLIGFGQHNVTFQVDMNQYSGTFTTPEVNGTFNNWCGNCAQMTDANSDNIWDIVISLAVDTFEFKFSYDNWAGQESLTPGSPCTITNGMFTNRRLIVTGDTVLPVVCWESCTNCSGTAMNANITFQVDLSDYTANPYTEVNLNGTFNNWCGNCAKMLDPDNDSIFDIVVPLPVGDTIEYKFTLDGWTFDEQLMPGMPCTMTDGTFTNRYFIPSGDTTLPPVCWESCGPCSAAPIGIAENWTQNLSVGPNPSNGIFNIQIGEPISRDLSLAIYDIQGKMIYQEEISAALANNRQIRLDGIKDGIYMLNLTDGHAQIQKKIVIAN